MDCYQFNGVIYTETEKLYIDNLKEKLNFRLKSNEKLDNHKL